eukprot:CAMPEP_0182917038 /NCGR_PEP_ID=MMETSP0105_2-20130417/1287_1 /TAXON_ID=81532 ORGANISM="Acanthoeca-like sp., Strain 10tr" /NCGR_SAMPLE_ID=MMETSP0105_2 /ASSEMBLY_ACC=CAM_ASM_000205 /LENGTH=282 /DNA_ID=CAMNT_0025054019 /DNA_START=38 /DNA_END=886 /DNA_ORIENTATION=-
MDLGGELNASHSAGAEGGSNLGGAPTEAGAAAAAMQHERDLLRDAVACTVDYERVAPAITVEEVVARPSRVFVLRDVLTPGECRQHIDVANGLGFGPSPMRLLSTVNATEFKMRSGFRNSERVMLDAPPALADEIDRRVQPHLPKRLLCDGEEWELVRMGEGRAGGPVNRRWRYNRYTTEGFFKPHYDAGYVYGRDEKTLLTFILYLNDGFDGGETSFFPDGTATRPEDIVRLRPRTGSASLFFQAGCTKPLHEGTPHRTEGAYKYILRSEIAYRRIASVRA